jgi:hypothetical protein
LGIAPQVVYNALRELERQGHVQFAGRERVPGKRAAVRWEWCGPEAVYVADSAALSELMRLRPDVRAAVWAPKK